MKNSSLEITDQEYLIKLNKNDFSLAYIYQLLKDLSVGSGYLNTPFEQEEDLRSRSLNYESPARFDRLSDK